jgi:hypothetical protein
MDAPAAIVTASTPDMVVDQSATDNVLSYAVLIVTSSIPPYPL